MFKGHTGLVRKVQFAAGLFHNPKDQSDTRYMLVSESDAEDTQMVILWELDKRGMLVPSRANRENGVDANSLIATALQPSVSKLTTDYGWDPAEEAISALDQQMRNAFCYAIKLHKKQNRHCFKGQLASFGSSAFSPNSKTMIYLSQNKTTQSGPCRHVKLHRSPASIFGM